MKNFKVVRRVELDHTLLERHLSKVGQALADSGATALDSGCGIGEELVRRLFDCQDKATLTLRECTEKEFYAIIDSLSVETTCAEIIRIEQQMKEQELTPKENGEALLMGLKGRKTRLKKQLPAFIFGGHSATGKRKNEDMEASGLSMLDIDHMECSPKELYDSMIKGREKELGIAVVHMSPSGQGMHIVYELAGGETRAEANERIFTELGLDKDERLPEGYDKGVKDIARCSFAVPRKYFFYIDKQRLFYRDAHSQAVTAAAETSANTNARLKTEAQPAVATQHGSGASETRNDKEERIRNEKGTDNSPHTTIQDQMTQEQALQIFDRTCSEVLAMDQKGIDAEGHRHNNLLAILSTGICKTVPQELMRQVVAERMPSYASEAESQSLINDFYANYLEPNRPMPKQLAKIRAEVLCLAKQATATTASIDDDDMDDADSWEKQQQELSDKIVKLLPRGLSDTLVGLPPYLKMPVLCTVFPAAASYACGARLNYGGDEKQNNLMTVVVGPSGSGKSFCARRLAPWMKQMDEARDEVDKIEREYQEKCRTRKANEKAPATPHLFKQKVPFNLSLSQIVERLINAQGRSLFSFCEELGVMVKFIKRGGWSDLTELYTLGFDGGEYGQDYHSTESVSGTVNVNYSWSATTTHTAFRQFFTSASIENGLASRVIVSGVADHRYDPYVEIPKLSDDNKARIYEAVEKLSKAEGVLELPRVKKAIMDWQEKKRVQAIASCNDALLLFRIRSGEMAYRCAAVLKLLTGKESKNVVNFAPLMAEYIMREQIHYFGNDFYNTAMKASEQQQRYTVNGSIFDNLKQRFTKEEALEQKFGKKPSYTRSEKRAFKTMIWRWKSNHWIEKVASNTWEKKVDYASLLDKGLGSHGVTSHESR